MAACPKMYQEEGQLIHASSLLWRTDSLTHIQSVLAEQSFNINVPSAGNCFQCSWKAPFIELVKHHPPSSIPPAHIHTLTIQHLDLQENAG